MPNFTQILFTLGLFATSFCLSAGKSFQTKNIVLSNYWAILPTSYFICFMEVYIIVKISDLGVGWIVLPLGLGGACGCWFSMWLHKRIFNKKDDEHDDLD